jgi:hypothetical protein
MTYDARQNGLLMEIRSSKTRRFVQLVIVLVLVLVSSLCITIVAAPRSPFVQETVRRVMGLSIRTWRFPPLASAKYQTCTVKEAWMNATFEEENIAKHNIEQQIRTLSVEARARSDTAADDSDLLHTAARIRHRFEALDGICDATRRTWTPEPGRGASSST